MKQKFKKIKTKKKIWLHIILILLLILLEESIIWCIACGPYFFQKAVLNEVYGICDMEFANWIKEKEYYESMQDPIIVIQEVDCNVYQIKVQADIEGVLPSYVDVFYTTENDKTFNGENMSRYTVENNSDWEKGIVITLKQDINNLRIDLGDDIGVHVKDISVTINPIEWKVSISRIVAVFCIYIFSILLFRLQESPDYDI